MSKKFEADSKFLSYVLRHQPQSIGLTLDNAGWADIDALIACAAAHGKTLDSTLIEAVVASNDKQRFALDAEHRRIRANQGHTVKVDLGLQARVPPVDLLHGTATRFVAGIREQGLRPSGRLHVHLSEQWDTTQSVGSRYGAPKILRVRSGAMQAQGHRFYRSDNGVWLTEYVPSEFIDFDYKPVAEERTVMLFRPTGPTELELVRASGFKRWPPRLPEQPIFYPVTNEQYAIEIARDWNVKASGAGFVARFRVRESFMQRYRVEKVGGAHHTEWWIPAEELETLNDNIVGLIEVIGEFQA